MPPSKYSDGIADEIISCLRLGMFLSHAARACGIHPDTIRNWRARYPDFDFRVREAEGKVLQGWLKEREKAKRKALEKEDYRTVLRALEWDIEKRFPRQYGSIQTVNLQGDAENPLTLIEIKKLISKASNGTGRKKKKEEDASGNGDGGGAG